MPGPTTRDNIIIPDIFTDAVQAAFEGGLVALWGTGVAVVNDTFTGDPTIVGSRIRVPYFSSIGEFQDVAKDGDQLVPTPVGQTEELALVTHSGLSFKPTRWSRSAVGGDIYQEGARQILEAARRKADTYLIAAASDLTRAGTLVRDVFTSSSPPTLDWDLIVDGKMQWSDEQEDIALMVVHSKVLGDLYKLKSRDGRALLIDSMQEGQLPRILGVPIGVSDRMPIDGSVVGPVTAAGTNPPVVSLTGSPTGLYDFRIALLTAGPLGTSTFQFSTDKGRTWQQGGATAPSVALGTSGVTANFAQAAYGADNVYSASSVIKHTTLLLKRGALAYWYNRAALVLQTWRDILADADVAAMHLYAVAHRYVRMPGRRRSGCVVLRHG